MPLTGETAAEPRITPAVVMPSAGCRSPALRSIRPPRAVFTPCADSASATPRTGHWPRSDRGPRYWPSEPAGALSSEALRIPKLIWAHQTSSLAPNGPIQHVLRRGRNRLAGALSRGIRMKSVRTFSGAGPCITLGLILREMDHCVSYRDRQGVRKFISKDCAVHTEPCPACPDHPRTKYPEGYWD